MKTLTSAITFLFIYLNSFGQLPIATDSGGSGVDVSRFQDEITPTQKQIIFQELQASRLKLQQEGLLPKNTPQSPATNPSFIWPLRLAAGLTDPGYCAISNYVDRNPAYPNLVQDYNCGSRTYDNSSGYNHQGTDIFTWPFSWYKVDNNQVEIIAAAAGVILYKSDGNFDRNCSFNASNWNAVYVQHADGSVTWYGHMKSGSLTTKTVGQAVASGEYLGVVGSSGNSTGPHLHFEVYNSSNQLVDPWNGTCNISASWWTAQQPYYNSQLNKLMTCNTPPVFPTCPGTETLNERTIFCQGNQVYFTAFYRDQQNGQIVNHKILQPNGTTWTQWNQTFTTWYSASWWYYSFFLPNPAQTGLWKYQITYQGNTYETTFTVNAGVSTPTISPSGALNICSGQNAVLTSSAGISYSWSTGATTPSITVTNAGSYTVSVNNACGTSTSAPTTVSVLPNLTAGISISVSPSSTICSGANVTFTANPANGGATPSYQWKLNGANVGTNSASYSTTALANGSQISCVMTSNANCISGSPATSNVITMTVVSSVSAGVSISANPGISICSGSNVIFTATPTNGGASPSYQWKKNGSNVGLNSPTYSDASLLNGDVINCAMTSNATCVIGNPANSSSLTMSVTPLAVIGSFSPTSGQSGSGVVISGSGFTGTTSVKFNGTSASFSVVNASQINVIVPAAATTGVITVTKACNTASSSVNYTVIPPVYTLTLKVFIEGFYRGSGLLQASVNPNLYPTVCDTVTVQIAQSIPPFTVLYSDKKVINTSGTGTFTFSGINSGGSYYIIVKHRNSIRTWSESPITLTGTSASYDFTNIISKAYGNNMISNGDGTFSIRSGDTNQDGVIEIADYISVENSSHGFISGYVNGDLTGDNLIESSDFSVIENNSQTFIYEAHP